MHETLLVLALAVAPCAVSAQEAAQASGWSGLNRSALSTVYVLDDTGAETKGKLLRIDPEAIVLLVDGTQRRFDSAHVRRVVKRGDSLKNGAVAGAVFGVVMGILAGSVSDCSDDGRISRCSIGPRVVFAAVGTAFYAAVGAGIDAAIQGRTTLYEAPASRSVGGSSARASIAFRVTW